MFIIKAGIVTNPMDVVKTRLMILRQKKIPSNIQVIKSIYKEEGLSSFFRAWHIRCMGISIVSIAFFVSYEEF